MAAIMDLTRLIRWGIYALLFTPLVFWQPLDFFFESTKGFYIMGLIEVIAVAYLWLICIHRQWRPKMNLVGWVFVGFVFVSIFASVLGVDPFHSFWSAADRIGGVLLWLHLVVFYFIASSVLRNKEDWERVFFLASIVGLIVSFIFFLTRLFPLFFDYSRGGSTFGNSTFFGIYLLFCIFFSSILTTSTREKRLRIYGAVATIFFAIVLWMTGALAAKYALIGGIILAISLWLLFQRVLAKRVAGIVLFAGLALVFTVVVFQLFDRDSWISQKFIELSSGSRFAVWSVAWEAFQERPLLGWGLENFNTAFFDHYNPCLGSSVCGGGEYWFDRAHNKILDTLVETGVVGLTAYLALLGVSIWSVWMAYRRAIVSISVPIIFTSFIATYFVQNIAEFDLAFSLLFLVLLLAFVSVLIQPSSTKPSHQGFSTSLAIVASLATLAIPFMFFHTVILPIQTNQSFDVVNAVKVGERRVAYEKQVNGSPIGRDYRRVFLAGETVKWILGSSEEDRQQTLAGAFQNELSVGIQALTDTVERSHNNVKATDLLGVLYHMDALYYHPSSIQKAESILLESLEKNPRNQHVYSALAAVYIGQGNIERAFELLQQAVDLDPSVSQSSLRFLTAVLMVGTQEQYDAQKEQTLEVFPQLQDEISLLEETLQKSPDQLYAVFY